MLYVRKSFTVPASSGASTSQRRFDYATMKRDEFIAKYGEYSAEAIDEARKYSPEPIRGE
jgi:hypothetical protein